MPVAKQYAPLSQEGGRPADPFVPGRDAGALQNGHVRAKMREYRATDRRAKAIAMLDNEQPLQRKDDRFRA